jgi:hypothetical protein
MNTTYLFSQDEILSNLNKITEELKKMQIENQLLRISQKKLEQKMNYTDNIIKLITGYNKLNKIQKIQKDDTYIINAYDDFHEFNDDDIDSISSDTSMPSLIEVDTDSCSSMPSLVEINDYYDDLVEIQRFTDSSSDESRKSSSRFIASAELCGNN